MTLDSCGPSAPELPERRRLAAAIAWAMGGLTLAGCGGGGSASASPTLAPSPTPSPAPTPAPAPPAAPPAGSTVTTLAVHSSTAGTWPYSATVLPLRGQLPSGAVFQSPDDGSLKTSVLSTYDDGSAAVVVVAGTATVAGAADSVIRLQSGSVNTSDAPLTAAAIGSAVSSVAVAFGSPYGTARIADFSAPERVWWANSRVICARYRVQPQTPGSTALEAVIDIHAYAGGTALVEIVVENCKMVSTAPVAPAAASYSNAIVTVNGSAIATVNGNGAPEGAHAPFRSWYASTWVGGNPGLRVTQAIADLQAHPLLFKMDQTSTFDMSGYASDAYTPWGTGRQRASNMGAGGDHDSIGPIPSWDARALQTGDYRGWNATEANTLVIAGYAINYRDSTTGAIPTFDQLGGQDQRAYNYWPAIADNGNMGWEANHAPAVGLMAFIARPSPIYIELAQKVAFWQGTWSVFADGGPQQPTGVFGAAYQIRGKAWCLRQLAHASFLTPAAMVSVKTAFLASLGQNFAYFDLWRQNSHAKLGCMWENKPSSADNNTVFDYVYCSATNIGMWQYHYLLVEAHKAASAKLLTGSNQATASTFADWAASEPVRWINEQPNGGWRYVPYVTAIGRRSDAYGVLNSFSDWGAQRADWMNSDTPPSVSGTWFTTGSDGIANYSGFLVDAVALAGYTVYFWSALVAAVERNVPGAATAWATVQSNVTGLSQWRGGFAQDPRWGSTPRGL